MEYRREVSKYDTLFFELRIGLKKKVLVGEVSLTILNVL